MTCKRPACRNPVSAERQELGALFCSPRCKTRHHKAKAPANRRRFLKQQAERPYVQFVRASDYTRRLKVGEDPTAQYQARILIQQCGVVAYENREGLICDIGAPLKPEDAGRVFSAVREPVRV